jgi:hypothetical protein
MQPGICAAQLEPELMPPPPRFPCITHLSKLQSGNYRACFLINWGVFTIYAGRGSGELISGNTNVWTVGYVAVRRYHSQKKRIFSGWKLTFRFSKKKQAVGYPLHMFERYMLMVWATHVSGRGFHMAPGHEAKPRPPLNCPPFNWST